MPDARRAIRRGRPRAPAVRTRSRESAMQRRVKIGGACAFFGDSSIAPPQLLAAGVDYLILDYLAEAAMSSLGAMRRKRPVLGYASEFTEWVWKDNLQELKRTGTRIVTNAG